MRQILVLSILALAWAVVPVRADDAKTKELDKKVVDLVKQATDLYKNAKSLHVEAAVETHIEAGDQKRDIKSAAVFDLQKPNLFAMVTKINGDDNTGPNVVCDGKSLFVHAKRLKQYIEEEAPEDLAGIGRVLPPLGHTSTGMLFQNLLTDEPYETLMDGVSECSYKGKEKVNDIEAHHLAFAQPDMKWELWVAAEGNPLVLKASSTRDIENGKMTTVETYREWKVDGNPAKSVFTFHAPEGVKKVKIFKQGN